MADRDPIALIIAGGSGTRFFPLSSKEKPKQFLKLFNNKSLLENTYERILPLVKKQNIFICGLESHRKLFLELGFADTHLILEPEGKNTAAAVALGLSNLLARGFDKDQVLYVLPADHYIPDQDLFLNTLKTAGQIAEKTQGLVTIGIRPTFPHTGYGYIKKGSDSSVADAYVVSAFYEKPSPEKANEYLETGSFYWNAGMFVWTLSSIKREFEIHCAELWSLLQNCKKEELKITYQKIPSLPIDIAIMEKTKKAFVTEGNFRWSDLGSWSSLYDFAPQLQEPHAIFSGIVRSVESKDCLVWSETNRPISLVGVKDLVVVETEDNLLICHRTSDQKIKDLV